MGDEAMRDDLRSIRQTTTRLHTERRAVRFQEVDAAGVVFHARIFDYFHDAYAAFLRERGASLERALAGEWMAPLARAQAEYIRPLRFGDEVEVSVVAVRLAETDYTVDYRIDVAGRPACLGRTHHVSVDPETWRRAAVPELLRRALDGEGGQGD